MARVRAREKKIGEGFVASTPCSKRLARAPALRVDVRRKGSEREDGENDDKEERRGIRMNSISTNEGANQCG